METTICTATLPQPAETLPCAVMEVPYVFLNKKTTVVHDLRSGRSFPSSIAFAREFVDLASNAEGDAVFSACWVCSRVYDRSALAVYANAAAFEAKHGFVLNPNLLHIKADRSCMYAWANEVPPRSAAGSPKLRSKGTKAEMVEAFDRFRAGEPDAEAAFFESVYAFGKRSFYYHLGSERPETMTDAHDVSQQVVIYALEKLPTFEGSGKDFYQLLCTARWHRTLDAITEADKLEEAIPLMVTDEEGKQRENPLALGPVIKRNGRWVNHAPGYAFAPEIPSWIEGTDRIICDLIRDGYSYAAISKMLGMTVDAITSRMKRIRERLTK